MITPEEAAKAMDYSILMLPESIKHSFDYEFIVSVEFANALRLYSLSCTISYSLPFIPGDSFKWRGFNCKVSQ